MVLPIENAMKRPQYYMIYFFSVMSIISFILVTFGSFGYLAFQEEINSIVTSNLPKTPLSNSIRIALIYTLLTSFSIQLFPALDILENAIFSLRDLNYSFFSLKFWSLHKNPGLIEIKRNIIRILVATSLVGVAVAIPHFGLLLSLVGSLGSSCLAFVFPSLFHLKLYWKELSLLAKLRNIFLMGIGIMGGVTGTFITVHQIIESF